MSKLHQNQYSYKGLLHIASSKLFTESIQVHGHLGKVQPCIRRTYQGECSLSTKTDSAALNLVEYVLQTRTTRAYVLGWMDVCLYTGTCMYVCASVGCCKSIWCMMSRFPQATWRHRRVDPREEVTTALQTYKQTHTHTEL